MRSSSIVAMTAYRRLAGPLDRRKAHIGLDHSTMACIDWHTWRRSATSRGSTSYRPRTGILRGPTSISAPRRSLSASWARPTRPFPTRSQRRAKPSSPPSTRSRLVWRGAAGSSTSTPGRLALVDAVECQSTFGLDPGRVVALVAGGADSAATAQEHAEDDAEAGAAEVRALAVDERDAVVGISASGRTPYVLGALEVARGAGALTVGVVCVEGSPIGATADREIAVVVGAEVLAGSTRLKAGTAQKLVLNTISTVSMIRLGKTYGNLMVDLVATNDKLRNRIRRIVELATGASSTEVAAALDASDGDAKVAIVTLLADVDASTARERLTRAGGVVRKALGQ